MQNGSKYVPLHLRNRCNGVPSVHVDNDKKSCVIGFDPNSVPFHLRNRVMQNGKHVPRNPVRQIDCNYVPPHLWNRLHGVPSERKNKTIEVTNNSHANLDADQGFADTDNADQVTESGNKNFVNLDAKQGCADTDTADQVAMMDKKRTNADTIKSTKSEADTLKNDKNHRFQINFIVRMNGINSPTQIFYQDLFASDDEGDHKMDICDDDTIDIIYTNVMKNNVAKLVAHYPQYEHRYLWNLYDNKGRHSSEFHRALYFKNADRNIIINQKKKDFNINRSIYEFCNVIDNGGSIVVFDFDMLPLVNMVNHDDDVFYDKIDHIWYKHYNQNNSKKDSGSVDVKLPGKKCADQHNADQDNDDIVVMPMIQEILPTTGMSWILEPVKEKMLVRMPPREHQFLMTKMFFEYDKDHNVPDFNTREDNEMHDNICANFDENNKAETTSNTRVENETSILSEMNDVIADDCISISEDNTSDIATSFFSRPEAGCDEPSGHHIPTLGLLAKVWLLKLLSEIRTQYHE